MARSLSPIVSGSSSGHTVLGSSRPAPKPRAMPCGCPLAPTPPGQCSRGGCKGESEGRDPAGPGMGGGPFLCLLLAQKPYSLGSRESPGPPGPGSSCTGRSCACRGRPARPCPGHAVSREPPQRTSADRGWWCGAPGAAGSPEPGAEGRVLGRHRALILVLPGQPRPCLLPRGFRSPRSPHSSLSPFPVDSGHGDPHAGMARDGL